MIKILYQIGIIFTVCWVAELIAGVIPFAFPSSVIAMILFFILLAASIIKVKHIREKSDFLLSNMAFFFIPATVGIMDYAPVLKQTAVPLLIISVFSTVITFSAVSCTVRLASFLLSKWRTRHGSTERRL